MPYSKNSPISTQKPVHIFYVWYTELCRRLNSTPATVVKPAKPKSQTVLNFVADRLKVEEWNPVIKALRHDTSLHVIAIKSRLGNYQFLHEIDTEEKLRQMKRRSGSLWTAFILKSLLKSLSCTVRNTQVLTCLEFDGLPMFAQYLEPLMKALQKNKTLKNLTLSRCRISDSGCQLVCTYVRFIPNIEVLNLSGCSLTEESGQHLAKLIKYQQINRYCESWHTSLRYSDPNLHIMKGIKRITLNGNPMMGDQGLNYILNELLDDLWIKAIDMQSCGITENMATSIINLVQETHSLVIADFRLNENLSVNTIDKILKLLQEKETNGTCEYQWCTVSYSLTCDSVIDTISNYTTIKPSSIYQTKSAPLKQLRSKMSVAERPVRKVQTSEQIYNRNKAQRTSNEQKVAQLSSLLEEEKAKRRETEKVNEELQKKLDQFIQIQSKPRLPVERDSKLAHPIQVLDEFCHKNGVKKKNGYKNGYQNGYKNGDVACKIFEKLIGSSVNTDEEDDVTLGYVGLQEILRNDSKITSKNGLDVSDSQISLLKFMENLSNTPAKLPVHHIRRPKSSNGYVIGQYLKKKA